jgi:hypothetical protein
MDTGFRLMRQLIIDTCFVVYRQEEDGTLGGKGLGS